MDLSQPEGCAPCTKLHHAVCMHVFTSTLHHYTINCIACMQVAFPISWLAYAAPRGWQYINFLHFLAPFVVLGIGLDDIFVFVSFFEDTRPYARHFALDTRLSRTFSRASGACLATSTTSAFAFAANVFSPVPAVQSFGLLLATLVIVNYVLAITWLPVCLAAWDKHIMFPALARADEAANFGGEGTQKDGFFAKLCCCLETVSTDNFRMSIRPGEFILRQPPRVLEYGRVAWPFLKPPGQHRLATPRAKRPLMLVPEPEFRQQSWMEAQTNVVFKRIFDGVFKYDSFCFNICFSKCDKIFRFGLIRQSFCLWENVCMLRMHVQVQVANRATGGGC